MRAPGPPASSTIFCHTCALSARRAPPAITSDPRGADPSKGSAARASQPARVDTSANAPAILFNIHPPVVTHVHGASYLNSKPGGTRPGAIAAVYRPRRTRTPRAFVVFQANL